MLKSEKLHPPMLFGPCEQSRFPSFYTPLSLLKTNPKLNRSQTLPSGDALSAITTVVVPNAVLYQQRFVNVQKNHMSLPRRGESPTDFESLSILSLTIHIFVNTHTILFYNVLAMRPCRFCKTPFYKKQSYNLFNRPFFILECVLANKLMLFKMAKPSKS